MLWIILTLGGFALDVDAGTSIWDLEQLQQPPRYLLNDLGDGQATVLYDVDGKDQYALLAVPTQGEGPFPAVLCISGFNQPAVSDWARHWAQQGYVALVIDNLGTLNGQPITNGVAPVNFDTVVRLYAAGGVKSSLYYEKVAACIRGISLLASLPQVDSRRVAVTGLSWGGVISCIVAGVDHRVACAAPTYGSIGEGFVGNISDLLRFNLSPQSLATWIESFDGYQYLPEARCPILFINGSNDPFYHLALTGRAHSLSAGRSTLCIRLGMDHGGTYLRPWWQDAEVFFDACLKNAQPYPSLTPVETRYRRVVARLDHFSNNVRAGLAWTALPGYYNSRRFDKILIPVVDSKIEGFVPLDAKAFYLFAEDLTRLTMTSTPISAGPAAVAPILRISVSEPRTNDVALAIDGEPGTFCEVRSSADLNAWKTVEVASIGAGSTTIRPRAPLRGEALYYQVLVLP